MWSHITKTCFVRNKINYMSSYPSIMFDHRKTSKSCNVAILRKLQNDDKFTFSFHLTTDKFGGINKQFNMCRNIEENLSDFVSRLKCNVEKIVNKKAKNKKCKVENMHSENLNISFWQNGASIQDLSLKIEDVLFKSDTEFGIAGEKFRIDINPPLVESCTLPNNLLSGYIVYPHKLKLESAVKSHSHYEWFVSNELFPEVVNDSENGGKLDENTTKLTLKPVQVNVQHLNWIKRMDGYYFVPSDEDVNRYVKLVCLPKFEHRVGLMYELVSKSTVSSGPVGCPFEKRHAFTNEISQPNGFRIVSYNLLADLYADSDFSRTVLFSQCPPNALAIDYRKQLILKELLGYNADIICLQEVDNKIFDHDLLPVLSEKDGLDGVFDRKGGQVTEGLACFWRTTKFKKLDVQRYILHDTLQSEDKFELMWKIVQSNKQLHESMVNRTTAIQIIVLESLIRPNHGLIVGITHLYFKPDADHIRLLQTALCMGHLEKTLQRMKESLPNMKFSVILAGDFNSTPPFGVLQFAREGLINESHPDWSSCKEEQVLGLCIKHSFSMDSACGTPKYTNYTLGFQDCIDYIFYETDKLQVENIVPFPTEDELKKYDAIPNILFPSDHLASVVDLKWM